MKQSVLIEPQHSDIEETPLPMVGEDDVMIRVKACGICASELHGWVGDEWEYPRRYGHEAAGEVVEASGTQAGLTFAGTLVKAHGMLAVVGYHQGGMRQVDMQMWNWKGIDVLNAHERRLDFLMDCMRRGLLLIETGKIVTAPLITHRYPIKQVDQAFRSLLEKPKGYIKAVVQI